jgi:hypothetical protein
MEERKGEEREKERDRVRLTVNCWLHACKLGQRRKGGRRKLLG